MVNDENVINQIETAGAKKRVRLRQEKDLKPDERARLAAARRQVGKYRSHYECVVDYLKYCDLLVELRMKPPGYLPPIHKVQKETGIPCWRTTQRCIEKARGK
jgi:hypothetical protein